MARSSPLSTSRWAAPSSAARGLVLGLVALGVLVAAGMGCAHAPPPICGARVARAWYGRIPTARADEYDQYIAGAITKFRAIPGNRGYQLMRETVGDVTHFSVVSYWESRDAIHAYAGADRWRGDRPELRPGRPEPRLPPLSRRAPAGKAPDRSDHDAVW